MTHVNAPLNIGGRRRLVERFRSRPISHVAAEAGVSRACPSKWKNRYDQYGEAGLRDRSGSPRFTGPDPARRRRTDRATAAGQQVVRPQGRARTRRPRCAHRRTHRGPVAGAPGYQPPPVPRSRRIRQPAPAGRSATPSAGRGGARFRGDGRGPVSGKVPRAAHGGGAAVFRVSGPRGATPTSRGPGTRGRTGEERDRRCLPASRRGPSVTHRPGGPRLPPLPVPFAHRADWRAPCRSRIGT